MAQQLIVARSDGEIIDALKRYGRDLILLGGCSNVVLPAYLRRPVCLVATRGVDMRRDGDAALVTAAAGESWHGLVQRSLTAGLAGLENLALIPGSVGAAPIQNIGAYGVELAERLAFVRVFDRLSGVVRHLAPKQCGFGYRTSLFKVEPHRYAILSVTLRLGGQALPVLDYPDVASELERLGRREPNAEQVAEVIVAIRRRKLPDHRRWGNAGSFFQNPVVGRTQADALQKAIPDLVCHTFDGGFKLAAAQLIDRCGWRGRRAGRVGIWHRQPLLLVNYGGASANDFLAVARAIRASVLRRFAVPLELEPTVVGDSRAG